MRALLSQGELEALVRLLGDDDPTIVDVAIGKLSEAGEKSSPLLRSALESSNILLRSRAGKLLETLRQKNLLNRLGQIASAPGEVDLEEGLLVIAEMEYPGLHAPACRRELDGYAAELRPRLEGQITAPKILDVIRRYLYSDLHYAGNFSDYYNPENSYLNKVIESRRGIPISLSILYILLGNRLGLPIQGVGLPGHFLCRYEQQHTVIYIDAFHGGQPVSEDECEEFVEDIGFPFDEKYLSVISNREILARTVRNLIHIYVRKNDELRVKLHQDMLDVIYGEKPGSL